MEFGKLENIDAVNWSLPTNDEASLSYLRGLKSTNTEWRLGTTSFGVPAWVGKIFPSDTARKDYLYHYARAFNTIELNTTHYRLPAVEQVQQWKSLVPTEFKFCPKFFQGLSHEPNGLRDKQMMLEWQRALEAFGETLGVTWIQLPPYFDYGQRAYLHQFLESWPAALPLALEFRHSSWFQGHSILPALADYLRKKNIGLIITDVAGRRDVLHSTISAPFVLLRFIGNSLDPSDFSRVDTWRERLRSWTKEGLEQVYFFAHEPDEITNPELTDYIVKSFNAHAGTNWVDPWHQSRSELKLL